MTDPAVTAHHSNRAAFISQLDTRERVYEQPYVAVTLHCTTCKRSERSGPCFDHEDALDLMSTLGWCEEPAGSDAWLCSSCAPKAPVVHIDDLVAHLITGGAR